MLLSTKLQMADTRRGIAHVWVLEWIASPPHCCLTLPLMLPSAKLEAADARFKAAEREKGELVFQLTKIRDEVEELR